MLPLGQSSRRALLDAEMERLAPALAGVVADLGGRRQARGRFKAPLARCRRWLLVNIDPAARPDLVADVAALPLRDRSVDWALCVETLQYVVCPDAAVAEMARILAPGGQAVAATPFLHRADTATDRHRFTEVRLRELFEGAGFEIVRVAPQGSFFTTLANFLRQATARIPVRAARYTLALLVLPLSALLQRIDRLAVVRRSPFLSSFTTGFFLVARKV